LLIGGRWVGGQDGATFAVENPATGEALAHSVHGDTKPHLAGAVQTQALRVRDQANNLLALMPSGAAITFLDRLP
jgi:acyl-CoA reductase-like NAD-dependent aldehyde dehydrogenase